MRACSQVDDVAAGERWGGAACITGRPWWIATKRVGVSGWKENRQGASAHAHAGRGSVGKGVVVVFCEVAVNWEWCVGNASGKLGSGGVGVVGGLVDGGWAATGGGEWCGWYTGRCGWTGGDAG